MQSAPDQAVSNERINQLKTLERKLGLGAVVAISISAMLGSGIFVLPGLAAAKAGSMVWLAYLVAGLTVLPAALSQSELGTAMPTSGGTYIYLERTFGPLAGTISGLGLWLTMLLKSAFALVGFSAYLSVLVLDVPRKPMAISLLVAITILNILGVSIISKMQKFIISGVLIALLILACIGLGSIDLSLLESGFSHKGHTGADYWFNNFLAATAFVYVSYAGVTKIAAIAEEVKNPDRNLPLGILISWFLVMCVYVFVVFVLVTNVSAHDLTHTGPNGDEPDLHPIYTLTCLVAGKSAGNVAAALAVITMISMAVAGLLAASRFPFAMSRDQLLPESIKSVNSLFKTPVTSILITSLVMLITILFLPVEQIAKLASAFMILAFMFVCGTVIVLREIAAAWYTPKFRSPLYPYMQILGIFSGVILLAAMGPTSLYAIGCIVIAGAASYFGYGRHKTSRRGVLGKMGPRKDLVADLRESANNLESTIATSTTAEAVNVQSEDTLAAVVVPLFGSERSPETLVGMGASLAHGRKLEVMHLTPVPEQLYLADALEDDQHSIALSRRIHAMAEEEGVTLHYDEVVTRDVVQTIHDVAGRFDSEWVVMESAGRRRFGISFQNPLGWLQDHLPCNLAVFKDAGVRYIREILVYPEPGPHDSLVVATADHLASVFNARLNFIYFVEDGSDGNEAQARADYVDQLRKLCLRPTKTLVVNGIDELQTIRQATPAYDLMIMGAAPNRTMTSRLVGTAKDKLTRDSECSVLWLKTPKTHTPFTFDVKHLPVETDFDLQRFVHEGLIRAKVDIAKKEDLFQYASDLLVTHYPDISPIVIKSALWEREQAQNTFVDNGLAMPHATLFRAGSLDSSIVVLTTSAPINYGKGNEADVFIFTTSPPDDRHTHLTVLAGLARLCLNTGFLDQIRQSSTVDEIRKALNQCLTELKH